jgi:hypothetical protein
MTDPQLLQPALMLFSASCFCRGMTLKPSIMLLEVVFCRFPDSLRLAERCFARGDFRINELDGFSVRQPALPGRDRACGKLRMPTPTGFAAPALTSELFSHSDLRAKTRQE